MGGWAIIGSILATLVLIGEPPPMWIVVGVGGLVLSGQYDDWRALHPCRKLLLELLVLAVSAIAYPGPILSVARLPLVLISGLFLLASINAYNLIDGLDGLAAGAGIASALGVSIIGVLSGSRELGVAGFAVAGALAGFMLFNYPPARIFMGDCGALPLGFLLGAFALQTGMNARPASIAAAVAILLMLVPLLDVATVSIGRSLRGSPLTRRGRDHAHYKLIALGFGEAQVAALCWTVAAAASLTATLVFLSPRTINTLFLPIAALPVAVMARAVLELDDINISSRRPMCRDSAIGDGLRLLLAVAIDELAVAAAFIGAALLRMSGATISTQAAALWSSLPIVLFVATLTLIAVGAYRRAACNALRIEWAHLGGASSAAGIILILIDYWHPIIFSGWIALLFVILLWGALAGVRATGVSQRPASMERTDITAPPTEIAASRSIAPDSLGDVHNETESSTKLLAR